MFDTVLDPLIERMRPHAVTMRDYTMMFCTAVIERLDRIADAVQDDTTFTVRREFHQSGTGATVVQTVEVPSNENWELESVVARTAPAAAGTLDIVDQGAQVRAAFDIAATGALTGIFEPIHFAGGSILVATMSKPGQFHLVFKHERIMPRAIAINGFRNPHADRLDRYGNIDNDQRHEAAFKAHAPIMGPHSRDASTGHPPMDD